MTNREKRLAGLKYQLRQKKERDFKRVIWKLTDEQKEYVERLGYVVIPFIYEIKTKVFPALSNEATSIIRDIHWSGKKGKKQIIRKLKKNELKKLDEYGIRYRVFKYEIILQ